MNVLSIIPARGGSKGIRLKNLINLNGKPLLYYSIKSSQKSKFITRTIVTTDHPKIANLAKKLKADVIIRPKNLSTDKAQIEPAMQHVLTYLKKSESYVPDVIVLLQNTSPLRTSKNIDEAFLLFKKGRYDSLLSASPSHQFLWRKIEDNAKPLNYNPKRRPNRQEIKTDYKENGAIYVTKHNNFMNSICRVSGKIGIYQMSEYQSFEVDSMTDLAITNFLMKNFTRSSLLLGKKKSKKK